MIRAELVGLTFVFRFPVAQSGRITRFGKDGRQLASLAEFRQSEVVERRSCLVHFLNVIPARAVVFIKGVWIFLGQPVHILITGDPGVELRYRASINWWDM